MLCMRAVLQVCKVLGIKGSKNHELYNEERLINVEWHLFKTTNEIVKVRQSLPPHTFFSSNCSVSNSCSSLSYFFSYNCDQNSVLRATVLLLMQTCSHPLG